MIFVDTSGWYAYLIHTDLNHAGAVEWMDRNEEPLLTTDDVVDETLTLLRNRGHYDKAVAWGTAVLAGGFTTCHRVTENDFTAAWLTFRTYTDKDWSFTDCTSKVVMESFGIATAFSFDRHFRQFGTVRVMPEEFEN